MWLSQFLRYPNKLTYFTEDNKPLAAIGKATIGEFSHLKHFPYVSPLIEEVGLLSKFTVPGFTNLPDLWVFDLQTPLTRKDPGKHFNSSGIKLIKMIGEVYGNAGIESAPMILYTGTEYEIVKQIAMQEGGCSLLNRFSYISKGLDGGIGALMDKVDEHLSNPAA
ncbi:hypothetical protein CMI42_01585 [Candidatus Pacearchaeota archaeon]|nr:hypothetical protein [Candidatus Pacearchaeota archaeon]